MSIFLLTFVPFVATLLLKPFVTFVPFVASLIFSCV